MHGPGDGSVFARSRCKIAVSPDNTMPWALVKACKSSSKVWVYVEIWTDPVRAGIVRELNRWRLFPLGIHHVETPVDYHAHFHRSRDAWSGADGLGCQFGTAAGALYPRGGTVRLHAQRRC